MSISVTERLLFITTLAVVAYRYATDEWPVTLEVEE
jgi:hypothetical protein